MKKLYLLIIPLIIFLSNLQAQETGKFEDKRDGTIYQTVKIGNQIWMAQNLAYMQAQMKNSNNRYKFGNRYEYEAAKSSCPEGWHLPTESEWDILINYLGGMNQAGKKLISIIPLEGKVKSQSNFFAIPTGYFDYILQEENFDGTHFWTSTPIDSSNSMKIHLYWKPDNRIIKEKSNNKDRNVIRCIKN